MRLIFILLSPLFFIKIMGGSYVPIDVEIIKKKLENILVEYQNVIEEEEDDVGAVNISRYMYAKGKIALLNEMLDELTKTKKKYLKEQKELTVFGNS